MTISVLGETYTVSRAQKAQFDALVGNGVDEVTAARIALGTYEDINPEPDNG